MSIEDDIEILFSKLMNRLGGADEGAKKMLGLLVRVTLKYRDELVANKGAPLTVGETREALDVFMHVMQQQSFPETVKPRIKSLVIMWLDEVRKNIHH